MTSFEKRARPSIYGKLYPVLLALIVSLAFSRTCEPRLAKDQAGRMVSVPDHPVRIVSLAPSITEIVFALGEGNRLKGVTQHCDFPAEAESLPKVGSYVHLDPERIVALKPDLCIAVRDGNPRNIVNQIEALGIPVYAVDPRSLDTAVDTVLEIAGLLNAEEKGKRLADEMRARIERVKERVSGPVPRPRVFFQIGTAPIVSAGTNTIIGELIATAGGDNLGGGPAAYPRFSREQVLALQPDIIVITSMTKGQDLEQISAEWKKFEELPAVRNDRIYIVDANLFDRATPRVIEGLETLAGIIHPELFK